MKVPYGFASLFVASRQVVPGPAGIISGFFAIDVN
jgi:hypothetical protein